MMKPQMKYSHPSSQVENEIAELQKKLNQRLEVPIEDMIPDYHKILLDLLPIPIFYKDTKGVYIGCNKAFEEFLGKSREQIIGKTVYDMAPFEIAQKYDEMDRRLFENPAEQTYEWKVVTRSGKSRDVIFKKAPIFNKNGTLLGLIGIVLNPKYSPKVESFANLHEIVSIEEQFKDLVITDPLTGLFNLKQFLELVEKEIPRSRRYKIPLSLILIEIDRFSQMTDRWGSSVSDQMVIEISRRLQQCARATDIMGRIGDGEFAMLAISCKLADAINLAQRLRKSVESEVFLQAAGNIPCTISIGVVELLDNDDLRSFYRRANTALAQAKQPGMDCVRANPAGESS